MRIWITWFWKEQFRKKLSKKLNYRFFDDDHQLHYKDAERKLLQGEPVSEPLRHKLMQWVEDVINCYKDNLVFSFYFPKHYQYNFLNQFSKLKLFYFHANLDVLKDRVVKRKKLKPNKISFEYLLNIIPEDQGPPPSAQIIDTTSLPAVKVLEKIRLQLKN